MSFYSELQDAVGAREEAGDGFGDQAFADEYLQRLEAADISRDVVVSQLACQGSRGRQCQVTAHVFDEADGSLNLFIVHRASQADESLTRTSANRLFRLLRNFVEDAGSGYLVNGLERSSPEAQLAREVQGKLRFPEAGLEYFRFHILTDASMSTGLREIPNEELDGFSVRFDIWDVERMADLASHGDSEPIVVDLTEWLPHGLPVLSGGSADSDGTTLISIIPGKILADVFKKFGSRLLESNVRTFLSARGKVNRAIQRTLANEPDNFLALNNGLTTTATSVSWSHANPNAVTSIDNWQIVNGGQTTSSLAYYLRSVRGRSLDNVYVQFKLVVVDPSVNSEDLVAQISRTANSQNQVSEADFFSNHQFHRELESISRRVKPPAQEGRQYSTAWFYERTRGQYENEKNKLSATDQKNFVVLNPKSQKVTKTDWAKFENSWNRRPHVVSKGAQFNFVSFAKEVVKAYEGDDVLVNDQYFREGVAKALLFREARHLTMSAPWYSSGYAANISTYAVAKLAQSLISKFPGRHLDFDQIWRTQTVPASVSLALLACAETAHRILTDPGRPQANVTQWAKMEECWEALAATPVVLPTDIEASLASGGAQNARRADARELRKVEKGVEAVSKSLRVPADVISIALSEGPRARVVGEKEARAFMAVLRGKVPPEWQAEIALVALERCADAGLINQDDF